MPELPEVETVRCNLAATLRELRVTSVCFRRRDILRPDPRTGSDAIDLAIRKTCGSRVRDIDRLGKNLILKMNGAWGWIVHLGMSGTLVHGCAPPEDVHAHVAWWLEDGSTLVFRDPRRFGGWTLAEYAPIREVLRDRVGIDALDPALNLARFRDLLSPSITPIKCRLLDQRLVAGLGNIYADEILFAAGIDPRSPSCALDHASWERLFREMHRVLEGAVCRRGTTLSDYRDGWGGMGSYHACLAVYGKEGEDCPRCGNPIHRMSFRGRGTHFCPRCQQFAKGR